MQKTESARGLLLRVKQYASIAVDLALYSVAFRDPEAALEVLKIESKIDEYHRRLVALTSMAVRSPSEANIAAGVYDIAHSLDMISDAAGDLASTVIMGYPTITYLSAAINCCDEILATVNVARSSSIEGEAVDILLVKRGEAYILAPDDAMLEEGDLAIVRGTLEEVKDLAARVGDHSTAKKLDEANIAVAIAGIGDDLASRLIRLRSLPRQMLDLAFHALIYDSRSLAELVAGMEDAVDKLYLETVEYSYRASNPKIAPEMVSLAVFTRSMEMIADAAARISDVVVRGYNSVFLEETIEESEEAYLALRVGPKASNRTIKSLGLKELGLVVLALGRSDKWVAPVKPDSVLREGDLVLVKYYRGGGVEEKLTPKLKSLGLEEEE
ncbi:MAG: hypothetical protein LRS43_04265 [Desulfurococcales archaeon]|nr:hypothetical protein [Desulfurococcales archaeon]